MLIKNILFVDDELEIQKVGIVQPLEQQGLTVTSVDSGEAVLSVFNTEIHLVISDLELGKGIDGIELLKRIREMRPEVFRKLCSNTIGMGGESESRAEAECKPHIMLGKLFADKKIINFITEKNQCA